MSVKSKSDKFILNIFFFFLDEELLKMIETKSKMNSRLIESEKIAKEILDKHARYLFHRNESFKLNYSKLLRCAKLRGLDYNSSIKYAEATLDDIINRIKENCTAEVNNIDEYCYKYDGYRGNGTWNKEEFIHETGIIGADIKIHETMELYDEIIEETKKEYSNNKTLIKKKER